MNAKRFKLRLSKLGNGMITDTQKRKDLYFDKEFLDATLPKTNEWLNELHEENENTKSILDDFMWILNVLQANPNDTKRLGVARDMLQNMGVLLYDKEI